MLGATSCLEQHAVFTELALCFLINLHRLRSMVRVLLLHLRLANLLIAASLAVGEGLFLQAQLFLPLTHLIKQLLCKAIRIRLQ